LYVVLPAGLAAGTAGGAAGGVAAGGAAAGGADGAGVETGAGAAGTGAGALAGATGGATIGCATGADTGALTTGGGAVSTVATVATGVVAAGLETVAAADATASVDGAGAGAGAPPADVATVPGAFAVGAPAAGASTTATAGVAGTVASPDSPAAVRAPTAPAPARDALRGRRSALSATMRSAAGFVLAKPAVYTISTAAEPRATRLLPRGLDTDQAGASKSEKEDQGGIINVLIYAANRASAAPAARCWLETPMRVQLFRKADLAPFVATRGGMTADRSGSFDTRDAQLSISYSPS
jgi:hypothetical protein